MDVIRGKVVDIVFKHDASRIVQTVVKYGSRQERDEIAAELKGKYREMAQNRYSKVKIMNESSMQFLTFRDIVHRHKTDQIMSYPPIVDTFGVPISCPPTVASPRSISCPGRFLRALRQFL
jgi:hypothetical protein